MLTISTDSELHCTKGGHNNNRDREFKYIQQGHSIEMGINANTTCPGTAEHRESRIGSPCNNKTYYRMMSWGQAGTTNEQQHSWAKATIQRLELAKAPRSKLLLFAIDFALLEEEGEPIITSVMIPR